MLIADGGSLWIAYGAVSVDDADGGAGGRRRRGADGVVSAASAVGADGRQAIHKRQAIHRDPPLKGFYVENRIF